MEISNFSIISSVCIVLLIIFAVTFIAITLNERKLKKKAEEEGDGAE